MANYRYTGRILALSQSVFLKTLNTAYRKLQHLNTWPAWYGCSELLPRRIEFWLLLIQKIEYRRNHENCSRAIIINAIFLHTSKPY